MPLCSVETALDDLKKGRMIILVDDEDRENEGDLVAAAEFVTPEIINFMSREGRGLICLSLSAERADALNLPLMTRRNGSKFGTNFTVSIDAAKSEFPAISAAGRAHTVRAAVADGARPSDLVSPGCIFPLRAKKGGVLTRAGQTEGSVDLCRMAGLKEAAVICEIMKDDGTMARMADLEKFAAEHGLHIAANKDIICWRLEHGEVAVKRAAEASMPTKYGTFRIIAYENSVDGPHPCGPREGRRDHWRTRARPRSQRMPDRRRVRLHALRLRRSAGRGAASDRKGRPRRAALHAAGRPRHRSWPTRSRPTRFRNRAWTPWKRTFVLASGPICAIMASALRFWWIWAFASSVC